MDTKTRVLIVDDTVVYRRMLTEVVNSIPGMEAAGTASNGRIALARIGQDRPEIVLLALSMPEMSGLETLERIKNEYPDIGVIMVSGADGSQAEDTVRALQLGAIDFISKPHGRDMDTQFKELKNGLRPLLNLFVTRRHVRWIKREARPRVRAAHEVEKQAAVVPEAARPVVAASPSSWMEVLVIGVSTGGPNALAEVIPKLPASLRVPVLVVQHMPPLFTSSLAHQLEKRSSLAVREAQDGDPVVPGTVLIAPGGRHMVVKFVPSQNGRTGRVVVEVNDGPPVNSCRPSVDVLFESVATCYKGAVLAVVMTGMGEDGADGVRLLKRRGCYCLAQSEESCVVFGMPRAVVEAGLADEVVPLDRIAARICKILDG